METTSETAVAESPLREAETALGAAFTEVAGRRVPRRFGDPEAEYRAVREAAGVADRADRAQIRLWGRDPVKMVQGLLTNDLAGAPPGRGVYAAVLTPKGRMIAELRAFRLERPGGTEVLLDLPREALEGTREHLRKFVPPMFARWADVSGETGSLGVYGPRSRELLGRSLGAELPPLDEDAFAELPYAGAPALVVGTRAAGGEEGYDVVAPAEALPALWDALREAGAVPVGRAALETLRVEAGVPRYGAELSEEVIPTEAFEAVGMVPRAISFTKGCYTGQEVIVRIAHRGHVNRHLRGLRLGDAPAPAAETPLFHPETAKAVGRVTSAAFSPLLGETVALAYVRRELGPGDAVRVGAADGAPAAVAALPFRKEGGGAG
ncbi:MAG TPA: glycine cleavage T C-terminal barrel domain-containing protein [Longimicrobiaceae bacterium]|nr:glycine cleavage T C-terminal barrel domain-containing protein [Longimicrobiaceae bacterium]